MSSIRGDGPQRSGVFESQYFKQKVDVISKLDSVVNEWKREKDPEMFPALLERTITLLDDPFFLEEGQVDSTLETIQKVVAQKLGAQEKKHFSDKKKVCESLELFRKDLKGQKKFLEKVSKLKNPKDLVKLGEAEFNKALSSSVNKDFFFNRAFRCFEKAARIYDAKGDRIKAFELRLKIANAPISPSSPLFSLQKILDQREFLTHPTLGEIEIGAPLASLGDQDVKYGLFKLKKYVEKRTTLELKLTHTSFDLVYKAIETIYLGENLADLVDALKLTHFRVENTRYPYFGRDINTGKKMEYRAGEALSLDFGGLATVYIGLEGSDKERIKIIFQKEPQAADLQKIFSLMGLSSATTHMSEDVQKKYQFNKVLHFLYPEISYELEHNLELQAMPYDEFIEIFKYNFPEEHKQVFLNLKSLYLTDKVPGFRTLALEGVAEKLESRGMTGFFVGVGSSRTHKAAAQQMKGILSMGLLSAETRYDSGLFIQGTSTGEDYKLGSSDAVFTRMLTCSAKDQPIHTVPFSGLYQILIDPKAAELMPYCYSSDTFGARQSPPLEYCEVYSRRDSLFSLADKMSSRWLDKNEVMFKGILPPSYFKKILYQDARKKLLEIIENEPLLKEFFPSDVKDIQAKLKYMGEHRLALQKRCLLTGLASVTYPIMKHLSFEGLPLNVDEMDEEDVWDLVQKIEKKLPEHFTLDLDTKSKKIEFLKKKLNLIATDLLRQDVLKISPNIEEDLYLEIYTFSELLADPKATLLNVVGKVMINGIPLEDLMEETDRIK